MDQKEVILRRKGKNRGGWDSPLCSVNESCLVPVSFFKALIGDVRERGQQQRKNVHPEGAAATPGPCESPGSPSSVERPRQTAHGPLEGALLQLRSLRQPGSPSPTPAGLRDSVLMQDFCTSRSEPPAAPRAAPSPGCALLPTSLCLCIFPPPWQDYSGMQ